MQPMDNNRIIQQTNHNREGNNDQPGLFSGNVNSSNDSQISRENKKRKREEKDSDTVHNNSEDQHKKLKIDTGLVTEDTRSNLFQVSNKTQHVNVPVDKSSYNTQLRDLKFTDTPVPMDYERFSATFTTLTSIHIKELIVYYKNLIMKSDNLVAMIYLSYIYIKDDKHKENGFELMERAASLNSGTVRVCYGRFGNTGDANAVFCLGKLYHKKQNLNDAIYFYTQAAEIGDINAMLELGKLNYKIMANLRRQGQATLQQPQLMQRNHLFNPITMQPIQMQPMQIGSAPFLYQQNSPYQLFPNTLNVGLKPDNEFKIELYLQKAISWFEKAANLNSAKAMVSLSLLYSKERHIKNLEKAAQWLKNAKDCGEKKAIEELENLYREYPEVKELMINKELAAAGNIEAMLKLGILYISKDSVRNQAEGIKWLEKSAHFGNVEAMICLGELYYSIKPLEKAIEWYEKAAEKGDITVLIRLGDLYLLKANERKAIEWYEKAANANNMDAMLKLGNLYSSKNSSIKVLKKSASWYQKAEDMGNETAKNKLEELNINYPELQDLIAKIKVNKVTLSEGISALINLGDLHNQIDSTEDR
ncbi:MAG: tetratricopeptide repeat protein [Neisseriaceae bacterium]